MWRFTKRLNLRLIEPLRELFKDEVRELGKIRVTKKYNTTTSFS